MVGGNGGVGYNESIIMKILFLFVLISVGVPGIVFAQNETGDGNEPPAQLPVVEAPETLEEAKDETLQAGDKILEILPGIIGNIWDTQVIPVWKTMWRWTYQDIWQERLEPVVQGWLDRGKTLLGREVEQRAPLVEQELEQEKQEFQEELAQQGKNAGKSLWERFWALFQTE